MDKLRFESIELMKKKGTYKEIKIKCIYCDLKDICHKRKEKEEYEKSGWITKCPFTPNNR